MKDMDQVQELIYDISDQFTIPPETNPNKVVWSIVLDMYLFFCCEFEPNVINDESLEEISCIYRWMLYFRKERCCLCPTNRMMKSLTLVVCSCMKKLVLIKCVLMWLALSPNLFIPIRCTGHTYVGGLSYYLWMSRYRVWSSLLISMKFWLASFDLFHYKVKLSLFIAPRLCAVILYQMFIHT